MESDDDFVDLNDSMSESDGDWTSGSELSDQEEENSPPFRGLLSRATKWVLLVTVFTLDLYVFVNRISFQETIHGYLAFEWVQWRR